MTDLLYPNGWLLKLTGIILLVILFNFLARWLLVRLEKRFRRQGRPWQEGFVSALYLPLSYYAYFFAFIHSVALFGYSLFSPGFFDELNTLLKVGGVLALAWFAFRLKKNSILTLHDKSRQGTITLDRGKIDVLNKLGTVLIFFLLTLGLLEVTHRSITTLLAFGGVGGLAIAIASQEVIANFFGGFMIYMTHPFGIGDLINLPEKNIEGHVEEIGWYMTRIRTLEKRPMYIPNAVFSKVIVTTTSRRTHHRFRETIGVRYTDMPQIQTIMEEIKQLLVQNPAVDKQIPVKVYLGAFGEYSLDINVTAFFRADTPQAASSEFFDSTKQEILFKIYNILAAHNAELAVPITYVEMRS